LPSGKETDKNPAIKPTAGGPFGTSTPDQFPSISPHALGMYYT